MQSASQMLSVPINVCLNDGMTWPVRGKSAGRWGKFSVPMPIDVCTWPVSVSTSTLDASVLNFRSGAALLK